MPLDWAMTQINLGNAFFGLGAREDVTKRLEEDVSAYNEALKELTPEAASPWHDGAQKISTRRTGS